jgi:hypothetical protein
MGEGLLREWGFGVLGLCILMGRVCCARLWVLVWHRWYSDSGNVGQGLLRECSCCTKDFLCMLELGTCL